MKGAPRVNLDSFHFVQLDWNLAVEAISSNILLALLRLLLYIREI